MAEIYFLQISTFFFSSSGAENSPRNRGSSSKLHRCKAELTPGHYPWPASATASNPSPRFQASQVYSQEDEDLIQKVTDLNFSQFSVEPDLHTRQTKTERQSNKVSKRENRQNQLNQEERLASKLHPDQRPQLTSMQLAILVREKLHKECINLANAPFNSKVGTIFIGFCSTVGSNSKQCVKIKIKNFWAPVDNCLNKLMTATILFIIIYNYASTIC